MYIISKFFEEREGSGGGRRGKSKGRRPHLDDIGDEPYQARQQEVGELSPHNTQILRSRNKAGLYYIGYRVMS